MATPINPDELELTEKDGGTRMRLRVKAGARRNAITGVHAGALKVSVTAAAERGRANRAVLQLVADALGLAPSSLELTAGHTSPDKTLRAPLPVRSVVRRLCPVPGGVRRQRAR